MIIHHFNLNTLYILKFPRFELNLHGLETDNKFDFP